MDESLTKVRRCGHELATAARRSPPPCPPRPGKTRIYKLRHEKRIDEERWELSSSPTAKVTQHRSALTVNTFLVRARGDVDDGIPRWRRPLARKTCIASPENHVREISRAVDADTISSSILLLLVRSMSEFRSYLRGNRIFIARLRDKQAARNITLSGNLQSFRVGFPFRLRS